MLLHTSFTVSGNDSFALAMLKTETRHYAYAEQFMSVAEAWDVQQKVTTVGTDGAHDLPSLEEPRGYSEPTIAKSSHVDFI